jgi:serine/threonine protein kinase
MLGENNGKKLGEGTYGIVRTHTLPNGEIVAIKKFRASDEGIEVSTLRELHALNVLKGYPHILQIITIENIVTRKGITKTSLIMPLYVGDLKNLIEQIPTSQRIKYFDVIMNQLLKGCYYMYQKGIIHRDIKPQNILVNYYYDTVKNELSAEPDCYIADLGLARQLLCTLEFRQVDKTIEAYTVWYRPPEIFARLRTYNENADIWALACTLVEYITNVPLFQVKSYEETEVMKMILKRLNTPLEGTDRNLKLFKNLSIHDNVNVAKFIEDHLSAYHYNNIPKRTIETLTSMLSFNYKDRVSITDLISPPSYPVASFSYQKASILSKEINNKMYNILIDWIFEVAITMKLNFETFVTSLDILNRYLSVEPNTKRIMFQLIGAVCLSLASKMQEIYSPEIFDYVHFSDGAFDSQQFKLMEKAITEKLNYIIVTCEIDKLVIEIKNFVESTDESSSPEIKVKKYFDIFGKLLFDIASDNFSYIDMSYDEILNFLYKTQFMAVAGNRLNHSPNNNSLNLNNFTNESTIKATTPRSTTTSTLQNPHSPKRLSLKPETVSSQRNSRLKIPP